MKIHIPTTQYGFIEAEVNSSQEARQLHDEIINEFREGSGLSRTEFNQALDQYLTEGTGITEDYLAMDKFQQGVFQEIKKHFSRIGTLGE